MTDIEETTAGFRLGDPIALHDLLALPPDGRRYERDLDGRLALMSPDSKRRHRVPLTKLVKLLNRRLDDAVEAYPEPTLALPRLIGLKSKRPLPDSRLGPKCVEPDVAIYSGEAPTLQGFDVFAPDGLRLVIEVLSPKTHRADLGTGRADVVDRWRTYLESGVPEYWAINAGVEEAAIPVRSGLFLRNDGGAWRTLEGDDLTEAARFRDLPAFTSGVVRSVAVPGLTLDLAAFWASACRDA